MDETACPTYHVSYRLGAIALADAIQIAKYILEVSGPMSAMKLQKLVYYCQAWSLVWDDQPLFPERIEAWANGPVVRSLYDFHRGRFTVDPGMFEHVASAPLDENQIETIRLVLDAYGPCSAQWLSDQTHSEAPWIKAREGLADDERGDKEISWESMSEFYSSLS